jgi:hypothetical protein
VAVQEVSVSVSRLESAVRPGQDPGAQAVLLRRVREAALSGGTPPAPPRPVIAASWRRVRGTGLDPGRAGEVPLLGLGELQRRRADSGLEPLLPLLRSRLLPAAEAAGQLLVVVDADGRVLWREGGPDVRRRADGLGFLEGSAWDEPSVGTNAIGTSLVVGRPVHVYAAEHYADTHQPWTCAAAPLHDPVTGRLLGAVDLSGPARTVHTSTVALVDAVARLTELELRVEHEQRLEQLRMLATPVLARLSGPALAVTLDGRAAASTGLGAPHRVALPEPMTVGPVWLPALGRCVAEPLPGGWLLRIQEADPEAVPTSLVLDLRTTPPRAEVAGPSGSWRRRLSVRHAEILLCLLLHPAGRSASQLAQDLFGDPRRVVTVRAEVSRLRRTLGPLLQHQPYRLDAAVRTELRLPERRELLVPASRAPVVEALRRQAAPAGR